MARSYVENLISFISNMRIGESEGGEPSSSLFKIKRATYLFEEIVFDTSKTIDVKDFVTEGSGGPRQANLFGGLLHFDASSTEGNQDMVVIWDYSGLNVDANTLVPDNTFIIGWGEGSLFPIYISNQFILDIYKDEMPSVYANAVVGWQGSNLRECIPEEYKQYIPEGATYEVRGIDGTNVNVWNGKLIGSTVDKEEYQPVINMRAFVKGDEYKDATIQLDYSKSEDFMNLFKSLTYEDTGDEGSMSAYLVNCEAQGGMTLNPIVAIKIKGYEDRYLLSCVKGMSSFDDMYNVVYSTYSGSYTMNVPGGGAYTLHFVEGANNLTKDGCLTIDLSSFFETCPIENIYYENIDWNGNLIGMYEGE